MHFPNEFLEEARLQLSLGVTVKVRADGDSMLPFIRGGTDVLWISPRVDARVGRIVFFFYKGRYIIHRVVGREGACYLMQGDGNRGAPERVKKDGLLGTVTQIGRKGKMIDPYSPGRLAVAWAWRKCLFARRYLLAFYSLFT